MPPLLPDLSRLHGLMRPCRTRLFRHSKQNCVASVAERVCLCTVWLSLVCHMRRHCWSAQLLLPDTEPSHVWTCLYFSFRRLWVWVLSWRHPVGEEDGTAAGLWAGPFKPGRLVVGQTSCPQHTQRWDHPKSAFFILVLLLLFCFLFLGGWGAVPLCLFVI